MLFSGQDECPVWKLNHGAGAPLPKTHTEGCLLTSKTIGFLFLFFILFLFSFLI